MRILLQVTPKTDKRIHAGLTVAWTIFMPIAIFTDLKYSVPLLVGISIYANIAGHMAAWQAAKADEHARKTENDEDRPKRSGRSS